MTTTNSGFLTRIATTASSFACATVASRTETAIAGVATLQLYTRTTERLAAARTSRAFQAWPANPSHTMTGVAFSFECHPLRRVWSYKRTPVFFYTVIAQRRATALGAKLDVRALVDAIEPSAPCALLETVFRRGCLAVVADPALLACAPEPTSWRARFADTAISTHS